MMHNTSRNCTRCRKDLTDAASMEAGIGPICRNLDNELLARLIPSNLPLAQAAFDAIDLTLASPETLRTLNEVYTAMFAEDASTRADWRLEVKRIEWALSFPANAYLRDELTKVVAALGYVGLAALWNGDAATGKSLVFALDGRLIIQGPNKAAARMAFRKIAGWKFHAAHALCTKPVWSFPAAQHEAFFTAIITHYPNFDGLVDACEAAKASLVKVGGQTLTITSTATPTTVTIPAPVPAPVKAAPKCSITVQGLFVKIYSPYKAEYITDLKSSFPYSDRRWNANEKCWEVVAIHQPTVTAIVKKHFGADALGQPA